MRSRWVCRSRDGCRRTGARITWSGYYSISWRGEAVGTEDGVDPRVHLVEVHCASAIGNLVGDAGELWPEIRGVGMLSDQVRESPLEVIEGCVEFEARSHVPILARRRLSLLTSRRFATARCAAASMTVESTRQPRIP